MSSKSMEYLTDTTTGSTGVANLLPKIWKADIIQDAQADRQFEKWAYVDRTLVGTPGKDVSIPVETNLTTMTNDSEGAAATFDEMDVVDEVVFTPALYRYAFNMSFQAVKQTAAPLLENGKRQMTNYARDVVDLAIGLACANAGATVANIRYGGDAAGVEDLEAGDIITTDLVADAILDLKSNKWKNEAGNRGFVLFIGPEQENAFLKDSQFVNAAEYGDKGVISTGEIGEYLGVKVVVTNNIPTKAATAADYTEGQNWAVAGNTCILAKGNVSFGIAYAEDINLMYEKFLSHAEHRVYLSMMFQAKTLQDDSIALIKVANV